MQELVEHASKSIPLSVSDSFSSFHDSNHDSASIHLSKMHLLTVSHPILASRTDCSIVPLRNGLFLISSTDFFPPNVLDPFIQGRLACANVVSDMYAMGIVHIDNMLMIMAVSIDMDELKYPVTKRIMEGFYDMAYEAGTKVTGGQTVLNPWPLVGGVAESVVSKDEFIMPVMGKVGDVLVLTKPLGTQLAVNVKQWMGRKNERYEHAKELLTDDQMNRAFGKAIKSMTTLNKNAASLMHKYQAHGATDVTGFGLLGHAKNLASNQQDAVSFQIHTLPILKNMVLLNEKIADFGLTEGTSAETSGGLLIMLKDKETAENYLHDLKQLNESSWGWIIGDVISNQSTDGRNTAAIIPDAVIIEV